MRNPASFFINKTVIIIAHRLSTVKKADQIIRLDPMRQTADIDERNNNWGAVTEGPSRFALFKAKQEAARDQFSRLTLMQKAEEKKVL